MIPALVRHMTRIMLFRHSGAGLPRRSLGLVLTIYAASAVVAGFVFGWWYGLAHFIVVLVVSATISPAVASGCALASMGFDAMRLAVPDDYRWILSLWEVAACYAFARSYIRLKDAPQPVLVAEIRLSPLEISMIKDEAMLEIVIVQKLKDAGVPVSGRMRFENIRHGALFRIDDPRTGDVIVRWSSHARNPSA